MEGGLATVYSFVDLAILRVGLAPVPSEAAATPKAGHCSTFKTENSLVRRARRRALASNSVVGSQRHTTRIRGRARSFVTAGRTSGR